MNSEKTVSHYLVLKNLATSALLFIKSNHTLDYNYNTMHSENFNFGLQGSIEIFFSLKFVQSSLLGLSLRLTRENIKPTQWVKTQQGNNINKRKQADPWNTEYEGQWV